VVAIGYGIVAPALPEYARSFNVGITAAAAVVSGFALVRLAFAPVSGRQIDRLGEPLVLSCGLLVVGASSAACAFARNYTELLVARSLGGVGSTLFTVAAASLLIRRTPSGLRGRAMAAWATGFLAGSNA
jgi:MFS family permease